MKKISYLIFTLSLFLYSNILSANVSITGITYPPEMNGTYTVMGQYNGKPYFELEEGMNTYSVFYYTPGMGNSGWMIFPGVGPYTGMWALGEYYFFAESTATFPPETGYTAFNPGMTMTPFSGTPLVTEVPAIPISLWGVVAVFLLAGGFLVVRHYKKQAKAA